MYKIIGIDHREYGPVSEEQVRQWLAEGRVDAQTKAQREGKEGWEVLGAMPEFMAGVQMKGAWVCPKCGAELEEQFDSCWRCSTRRPGLAAAPPRRSSDSVPSVKPEWHVKYEVFRGTFSSWNELFRQAAAFATDIGRDRLIGISHSEDNSDGVIAVWYWAKNGEDDEAKAP